MDFEKSEEADRKFWLRLWLIVAISAVCSIVSVTSCTIQQNQEVTKRIQAACAGNLTGDAARASNCTLAIVSSGTKASQ